MIRRISVPPFEALDPLLPRRVGSDPETQEVVAGILQALHLDSQSGRSGSFWTFLKISAIWL